MSVDALLSETGWLRALCRQLVRDEDRADDLFQDTVLSSLTDGASRRGDLRPWLAGVARHLVANKRRAEERRRRREAASARAEHVEATAATVARVAIQQHVIHAVRELPEAQRDAVLLRYFDDLPPRAIAERLGVPVATVKTRLKRGLAALRERLDAEHGDRRTWVAALLPIVDAVEAAPTGAPAAIPAVGRAVAVRWAAAAVLLVAATAAWLVWPERPADEAPSSARSAAVPTVAPGARSDAAPSTLGSDRIAVSPEPTEDSGRWLEVEVVDAATGDPVAGAEVRYARTDAGASPTARLEELEAAVERRELTYSEFLLAVSEGTHTDADGIARIALPLDRGAAFGLVAVHRGADARAEVGVDELGGERARLELKPRPVVLVQVVDHDGKPVGSVPIDLLLGASVYMRFRTPPSGEPLRLAVPFADPDWLEFFSVAIATPLREPVVAALPPAVVAGARSAGEEAGHEAEPVVLELPPTGTLCIAVRDPEGRPLEQGELHLLPPPADPDAASAVEGVELVAARTAVARVRVVDGEARLEHVGVGTSWQAEVRPDGWVETWTARVAGPRGPDAEARARVDAPVARPRVALVVSDPSGEGFPNRRIDLVVASDRGSTVVHSILLDAASTAVVPVPSAEDVRLTVDIHSDDRLTAPLRAHVTAPLVAPGAPGPALRVVVRPIPLLVAGRVVDASGRPVSNVLVRATPMGDRDVANAPDAWTDGEGRFAIHGEDPARFYRLTAERDDLAPVARDDVPVGQTDVELAFALLRTVRATVLCGGAELDLRLRMTVHGAPLAAQLDPEGRFRFPAVPSGSHMLEVVVARIDEVVYRDTVEIPIGDGQLDLPPIDLRERLTVATVTVRDPAGGWPERVWTTVSDGSSQTLTGRTLDAAGRFTMVVPATGTEVTVSAEGYEPVVLEQAVGECTVTLVPH